MRNLFLASRRIVSFEDDRERSIITDLLVWLEFKITVIVLEAIGRRNLEIFEIDGSDWGAD